MSPLAAPPAELGGFPAYPLPRERLLYRIHRRERPPWWFSSDGSGRFDLLREDAGTCYLAERPAGAFLEVFRSGTLIPEAEVVARSVSELLPPAATVVADCTTPQARGFGVTAALHSQPEYDLTRVWAQAFADAGFDGIRFLMGHDPSAREVGVALFGRAGEHDLDVHRTGPISADLIEEVRGRFALVVVPAPA